MANPLHSIPGLGGFIAQREANQAEEAQTLQNAARVLTLQQALQRQAQARAQTERELQGRAELASLGPNATWQDYARIAGKYGDVDTVMKMANSAFDRQQAGQLRQEQLQRLALESQQLHEYRMSQLRSTQERNAEIARHNRVSEQVSQQLAALKGQQPPKAPLGYRYKPDDPTQLEAIPGGPKDTSGRDAAKTQAAISKADTVIGKVNEALKLVSPMTTGLVGDVRGTMLGRVTGSGAYDLERTLDTIKANLGFSELQAMRDASPTGGALGQVAIQELAMLQSTIASLDKGQDDDILRSNLEQVRRHFENWKRAVMQSQQAAPAQAPGAPGGGWSIRPLP